MSGLTDQGYEALRTADFLAAFWDQLESDTGLTLNRTADSPLAMIALLHASRLNDVSEASQALYDAFDPGNATGISLDVLGQVRGVPRDEATFSQATVTLTGSATLFIPVGRIVRGGGADGLARWLTTADVTLAGGTGSVVVQAEDAGTVEAIPGEIDEIVTPLDGWTAVTNAAAASEGDDRESDSAYRVRQQRSLAVAGGRSLPALRTAIDAVEGVTNVIAIDNRSDSAVTVSGVSLNAHSVAVIVYPNTLTSAQLAEVATLIFDGVSGGIETMGTGEVRTVTDDAGYPQTVKWDYATAVPTASGITVVLEVGFALADVEATIQALVVAYYAALAVGEPSRILAIQGLVAGVDGVTGATVLIAGAAVDVVPDLDEILTISTNTVAV